MVVCIELINKKKGDAEDLARRPDENDGPECSACAARRRHGDEQQRDGPHRDQGQEEGGVWHGQPLTGPITMHTCPS